MCVSLKFCARSIIFVGRDSSVGVATGYGLEVRASNPRRDEIFHTVQSGPWGSPSLLYSVYRVIPGSEAAETRRLPSTPI